MSYLTPTRGLLGHFLRSADPNAVDQRALSLPIRLLTSSSLRAILTARAGGGGARVGAVRRKILRDGGGGDRVAVVGFREGRGGEVRHVRGDEGSDRGDSDDGINGEWEGGETEDLTGGKKTMAQGGK